MGGEEFAVLLPDSDERGAHVAAERMRRAIREGFADDSMPLTISFGIASLGAWRQHGRSDGERRPGPLHGQGDRPRLLGDLLAAGCGQRLRTRPASSSRGEARLASLLTLAESLDAHEHAATVGRYAREIGRQLKACRRSLENLMLAGILHDVGKVGIPSSIVMKPRPLSPAEGRDEKAPGDRGQHARGRQPAPDRRMGAPSPRAPDGRGYPRGLEGDDVPLEARISSVADSYEAMTHDRAYRPALGPERLPRAGAGGSQFDEQVVEAFQRVLKAEGGPAARGLSIFARG